MGFESNKIEKFETLGVVAETLGRLAPLARALASQNRVEAFTMPESGQNFELSRGLLSKLEVIKSAEQLECLSDARVTEEIAEYMSGLEGLKFENWKTLTLEQRRDLLNQMERRIAQIEHRPPLPIKVEKMDARMFGYQDSQNGLIALNSKYVMSNTKSAYQDVINTIVHEGRHAYQHYNVDKKCIHESLSVVNTWRENFYDPKYKYYSGSPVVVIGPSKIGNVGFRLYYYQPVEIDARNFASDVMLKLKQKGFLS